MRPHGQVSAAGFLIVVLFAALGFAAFSTGGSATTEAQLNENDVVLPTALDARLAAAGLAASLNPDIEPTPTTQAKTTPQVAAAPRSETAPATTSTTAAPTTTTSAPTTTAPPTTTTTTAAPTTTTAAATTTTTAAPTTTTTAAPTTTTAPSTTTTTPPVEGGPRDSEEWRSLVEQYFASGLVDDALAVIECESRGDPLAYNPASGASGLFQFIPSTWAWASEAAGFAGASPFDPTANVGTAAWLAQRSIDQGRSPWAHWTCKP